MSDLRERLVAARLVSENDGKPFLDSDDEAGADAALSVFAEWLREQEGPVAEQLRDQFPHSTMADHWFGARSVLHRLTDEIAPKGDEG